MRGEEGESRCERAGEWKGNEYMIRVDNERGSRLQGEED